MEVLALTILAINLFLMMVVVPAIFIIDGIERHLEKKEEKERRRWNKI